MSNETKWTPGPWVAYTNGYYWQVSPENGSEKDPYEVCDVCSSEPRNPEGGLQEANARLIAAAPELYEALNSLAQEMDMDGLNAGTTYGPMIHDAMQALAKARGEIE